MKKYLGSFLVVAWILSAGSVRADSRIPVSDQVPIPNYAQFESDLHDSTLSKGLMDACDTLVASIQTDLRKSAEKLNGANPEDFSVVASFKKGRARVGETNSIPPGIIYGPDYACQPVLKSKSPLYGFGPVTTFTTYEGSDCVPPTIDEEFRKTVAWEYDNGCYKYTVSFLKK